MGYQESQRFFRRLRRFGAYGRSEEPRTTTSAVDDAGPDPSSLRYLSCARTPARNEALRPAQLPHDRRGRSGVMRQAASSRHSRPGAARSKSPHQTVRASRSTLDGHRRHVLGRPSCQTRQAAVPGAVSANSMRAPSRSTRRSFGALGSCGRGAQNGAAADGSAPGAQRHGASTGAGTRPPWFCRRWPAGSVRFLFDWGCVTQWPGAGARRASAGGSGGPPTPVSQ